MREGSARLMVLSLDPCQVDVALRPRVSPGSASHLCNSHRHMVGKR